MNYPQFFDQVKPIKLYDPLGEFLGAFQDGIVEISYLDCVKLAGHSCPTVAGAYILASVAIDELFLKLEELPSRSLIDIEMREAKAEGVTGVIGNVIAFICGAGDEGGFAGIGGHFSRKNRLKFGVSDVEGDVRISRRDNGKWISLKLDTSIVGGSAEMMPLMQKALQGIATESEKKKFQELWQSRVEAMVTSPEKWRNIAKIQNRGE